MSEQDKARPKQGKAKNDVEGYVSLSSFYLRKALRQEGCPICRLVRESEERWLWQVLYEFTGDPGVRARFDRAFGLCHRHAHLLVKVTEERELVGGDGVARVYETVVKGYLRRLHAVANELVRGRGDRKNQLQGAECPLCELSHEAEQITVHVLLDSLHDPAWREAYQRSAGLCNDHLLLAIREASGRQLRELLLQDHLERLERLERALSELQRKQRYDVDEPLTPEEARSWREAIWRFAGMEYDQPLIRRR